MAGVQRIAKIDRQDRSAINVRRLMETDETARLEICPRQDVVAHDIRVIAVWVDMIFSRMAGVPPGLFMLHGSVSRISEQNLAVCDGYGVVGGRGDCRWES
jgi:hypothetical protein